MRKRNSSIILLFIVMTLLCSSNVLAGFYFYQSTAEGDCTVGATITARVYTAGQINNPAFLLDTSSGITDGTEMAVWLSNNVPGSTMHAINITATNAACSPSAYGSLAINTVSGADLGAPATITYNITLSTNFAGSSPSNGSTTGNNETPFIWIGDYAGVTYTLEVATTSGFGASIVRSIAGIVATNYQLLPAQELADDTYYWRVRAINGSGSTIDTTAWRVFTVDARAPIISNPSPVNNSWTASLAPTISITTNVNSNCRYATSSGVNFAAKTAFTTTGTTTHESSITLANENANYLYLQCNNSLSGSTSEDYVYRINRDRTGPSAGGASVSIDVGATYSTDTILNFTWAGFTDGGSGISSYYYAFTDNSPGTSGTNDASSPGQLSGASQGTVNVYVWAEDAVGNRGSAVSDSIIVDSLPPAFSAWSQTDITKYITSNFVVTVTITDTSPLAAVPTFRYRIGSDAWSAASPMTLIAMMGTVGDYRFTLPQQASPNTWFERSGENISYQVVATDLNMQTNNITRTEYINAESTAPVFSVVTNKAVNEDSALAFNLSSTDVDLNVLTYTCNISGATITRISDFVSTVSWTPTNTHVGSQLYRCNVTDGTFTTSRTFTITVLNVNDNPVLESIGALYAQEYEYFNYTLNASDVDEDIIIFNANATIFSINRVTGRIAFTPFSAQRGVYNINFSVSDGEGGLDYEAVSFTVGYCGDSVCTADYETCTSCELDCNVCEDAEESVILIEPRNCLNKIMNMQAVKLVTRASCEIEGLIINNKEVCGNESNTNLKIHIKVDDAWEEVAQILTDEDGFASFTPVENGRYKVSFSSDPESYEVFQVKECFAEEEEASTDTKTEKPKPSEPELPPIIEEPAVEEIKSKWGFFSVLLYFLILPLLLITLVISALTYVYHQELEKGKNTTFVLQMDKWMKEYRKLKQTILSWMQKTSPFKESLIYGNKALVELKKTFVFVKSLIREHWHIFIIFIGLRQKVKLQYFPLQTKDKKLHLLIISIIKNVYPQKKVDELLAMIHQYEIKTMLDVAAMLLSFDIKTAYYDPQPAQVNYLNILMSKGLQFKSKSCTRIDFESALQQNKPVVCLVNELGEKNTIVQSMVILYAFDKNNFYYHDYMHERQGLRASKDQFMHAWVAAGKKALFVKD